MTDDLINFVIDGSSERRGAIPADAFLSKLRAFISTVYAFERAFSGRPARQIELEIVDLTRNSPAKVAMRARTKAQGYPTDAALAWTFDQLERIQRGAPVDERLPRAAIDNVVDLASARAARLPEVGIMRATYKGFAVAMDEQLASNALTLRAERKFEDRPPWRPGVSRGSLFGELRGVMDFDGERQFFLMPPTGPDRVQCVFTEELRAAMNEALFRVVRVHGFLHYDGATPYPHLMEASKIDIVEAPNEHLSDLRGIFRDLEPPTNIEDIA
jgi:hypothetical protein